VQQIAGAVNENAASTVRQDQIESLLGNIGQQLVTSLEERYTARPYIDPSVARQIEQALQAQGETLMSTIEAKLGRLDLSIEESNKQTNGRIGETNRLVASLLRQDRQCQPKPKCLPRKERYPRLTENLRWASLLLGLHQPRQQRRTALRSSAPATSQDQPLSAPAY
jgi:hypothetical protein